MIVPVGTSGADDINDSDAGGDIGTSHGGTATSSGDIAVLATLSGGFRVVVATAAHVPAIVRLLADDPIAAGRESDPAQPGYAAAYAEIADDPRQLLVALLAPTVASAAVGPSPFGPDQVVGTLQLTFVPGLSRGGATRMIIEAVRVAAAARGSGVGSELMRWALDYGRGRGAAMAQLTTDQRREDAHRFYRRLGFQGTHVGMKLAL